ncbi:acyl-CoA:lysophosphatidylglycerol acyltransferase 1-like [Lingula anatina]|uniref:Acyl-CoA:lysophosphatidylglycerol acyltransferase 1-like n=1 Tax=Lingula anatina TaxID=7574 RepID=A0A1S3JAG5_LINAN|nr:acyl-CoA:lysophosphatidylglycerol acyltransferase 1-like [Lingula anatina]|eukprot:XP_013407191.2 acyl-CoA:lysophosphatidylglycerol acyltransferase 1-like [Lingula anatina]
MELNRKTSDPVQWTPYLIGKCIIRALYVLINNLYCIPAYVVWMFCFSPLRFIRPDLYWYIEGVLFKWLLAMVTCWMTTAGYRVVEVGENVSPAYNEEALVIVNHQSTADVPTMMHALQHKGKAVRHMMWIQDLIFKYTNFGVVSASHGDFFILQGKEHRNTMLDKLQEHIEKTYLTRDRKWILLFPEGGFLRKRRQGSQIFGQKNNFPILEHVTLPRVGAMKTVLTTLSKETLKKKSTQAPGGFVFLTLKKKLKSK